MSYPEVLGQLVADDGQASLSGWFAEPLTEKQARAALHEVRAGLRASRADRRSLHITRLAELIFRYWAGYDIEVDYRNSRAMPQGEREFALLELCYGQLLLSRKQEPAWWHLDKGFMTAAHLLEPDDYFTVLRRHELLRQLPLTVLPAAAAPLESLLAEARVIARLRGAGSRPGMRPAKHNDTVG